MLHGELLELLEFYVVAEKHVLVFFLFCFFQWLFPTALSLCISPSLFTDNLPYDVTVYLT